MAWLTEGLEDYQVVILCRWRQTLKCPVDISTHSVVDSSRSGSTTGGEAGPTHSPRTFGENKRPANFVWALLVASWQAN